MISPLLELTHMDGKRPDMTRSEYFRRYMIRVRPLKEPAIISELLSRCGKYYPNENCIRQTGYLLNRNKGFFMGTPTMALRHCRNGNGRVTELDVKHLVKVIKRLVDYGVLEVLEPEKLKVPNFERCFLKVLKRSERDNIIRYCDGNRRV